MKTAYSIYYPGRLEPETGEVDWPSEPGYARIKQLVDPYLGDGEPLEHVSVLYKGRRCDMFVSEIGHVTIRSRGPLPINEAATTIYRSAWMARHPGTEPDDLPTIAGVAVLFPDRVVWT